ncbi:hypothetical protein THAOC_07592 [Thalassiosira oceanica]|uniref:Uncharacterized protein n=1 Tax=Thalassiosira oceanica TaxID=159749 RepID=K0TC10_THAOC|nr:hypothetical protein THAOC_07592 [Thalassiosira oceanica]|eukprot:EJK71006.1 hypothetical protein THAOC_07592 [Thalassiosira oceanica]
MGKSSAERRRAKKDKSDLPSPPTFVGVSKAQTSSTPRRTHPVRLPEFLGRPPVRAVVNDARDVEAGVRVQGPGADAAHPAGADEHDPGPPSEQHGRRSERHCRMIVRATRRDARSEAPLHRGPSVPIRKQKKARSAPAT